MSDGGVRRALGPSRWRLAILVTSVAAFSARGASPIETDDATSLVPGTAPRPGLALVDPGAQRGPSPLLPAVSPPAPLPEPPVAPTIDVGPGGDDLHLSGPITLPGGDYSCANFHVERNAYVTFTGPTSIRATGAAVLFGRVMTTADDAPLTIVSAGTMTLGSYPRSYGSVGGASTEGLRSDLTLESVSSIGLSYGPAPYFQPPQIYSAQSSLRVRAGSLALGPKGLSAGLDIDVLTVGDVTARGLWYGFDEQGWIIAGVVLKAGSDVALRSAAGSISFSAGETQCAGRMTIEAAASIALDSPASLVSADGGLDLVAHGGRVAVTNGAAIVAGAPDAPGGSSIRARDGVVVSGGLPSSITGGSERLVIEAIAGDVTVGDEGSATGNDVRPSGALDLRANGVVRIRDGGRIGSARGATVAALGELRVGAGGALEGGEGALLVESGVSMSLGTDSRASGASVTLRAPGALSVAAGAHVEASAGDVELAGSQPTIAGAVSSEGILRVVSLAGTADVRGATLASRDHLTSFLSGSVHVIAFGAGATILAQGATLRSGISAAVSGDVLLRVVASVPESSTFVSPPRTPRIDPPYLVPSAVTLRSRRGAQELEVRGCVDLGVAGPIVAGNAIVTIGDAPLFADVVPGRRGGAVARGADATVVLGPTRAGSSRRPFTLRARGAFLPEDRTGELAVRISIPGTSAGCRVRLDAGRFDAGRGALLDPALFVAGIRRVPDGVRLTLAVRAELLTASAAPDVELQLADWVRHAAPSDFVASHGRWVASISHLTVDPTARTVSADVPLDALGVPEGGGALDLALWIDGRGVGALRVLVNRYGSRVRD